MQHAYAEVNGLRMHYVTAGQGPTILFLHGFPEFWYAWKDLLAGFAGDHRVVAPDLRGYNLTDKPAAVEAYAIPHLIADVKALLEQVSPGAPAVLVAHDWGGVVAWAFAATFPAMLEKLVIINAPHPTVFDRELATNPAQQKASGYITLFRSPQAEAVTSADNYAGLVNALVKGAARPDVFSDADLAAYRAAWAQPGALTGGLNYYRAAALGPPGRGAAPSLVPALHIAVPTLVIWGEQDTALLPGNLTGLAEYVPNLRVVRIPTGTHWVIHEEPARITAAIREFLDEPAPAGPAAG